MSSTRPSSWKRQRQQQQQLATFTPPPSPLSKRQRLSMAPRKREHICEFVFVSPSSTPIPLAVLGEEFMNSCNPSQAPTPAPAVKELLESIDEEWDCFCFKKKSWETSPSFLQAQSQRKMRVLMSLRKLL